MIRMENLTKYYGTTCALDGIDLHVQKEEVLGLLGPNGAGKTTALRILTCYLLPTSGTIKVKDIDVREHPLSVKNIIGYLPESAPLYPDMLVYDYLDYVASVRLLSGKEKSRRIDAMACLCGLRDEMHRSIGELSKGYKQRVGLAHAMMSDPEILVLDEPTSGLDPNQIAEIRSIIRDIGKQKTVIFSTHILSEAEATCDRIVIINKGRVVADGARESLSSTAQHVIRITLVGPTLKEIKEAFASVSGVTLVKRAAGESGGPRQHDRGRPITVHVFCQEDNRAGIYQSVKQREWIMLELVKERESLESIFRELTKEE
jgi:ABC-2 type transport system ATP-binding protein